jgi:hypothetical protein
MIFKGPRKNFPGKIPKNVMEFMDKNVAKKVPKNVMEYTDKKIPKKLSKSYTENSSYTTGVSLIRIARTNVYS